MSLAEKLLKKSPQYTRSARHLRSVVFHGTPRKWSNLALVELERWRRRVWVRGHPYLLIIDPCNTCNLCCPLCPSGAGDLGRARSVLSFEKFRTYFDLLALYLFEVNLYNWGESLLNRDVYRMIRHAQKMNVGTNLSSNFVWVSSDDMEEILDSGLEYLSISLDGTSQETYSIYRVGGDYERVKANVEELIRRRNARRRKTPVVEWQYIVMRHNEHQVLEAKRVAKDIGVDLLRFIPVGLPFDAPDREQLAKQWYPVTINGRVRSNHRGQQFGRTSMPGPCFYLYRSMVINPDGGVSPCCVVYKGEHDFGNLEREVANPLMVWNNAMYRAARSLFAGTSEGHIPTVCDQCDMFRKN